MEKLYENGQVALRFHEDGTGFIYYPCGSVALCASEASSYQKKFFAFDKNRKNTNILAIDENGVGFCSGSKRKDLIGSCPDMALTKIGGVITSPQGYITHTWKWDPKAQNSGTPPSGTTVFPLNEHISLLFTNKFDMTIKFEYGPVKYELDAGVKFKRVDSYLDHAKKALGGKLLPHIPQVTLRDRQEKFGKEMAAHRNKLHPRSENLSPMVQGIVGRLETGFDDFSNTLKLTHGESSSWKEEALTTTLSEIPRIATTGVETGISPGFCSTIYIDRGSNLTKTAPARLITEDGKWKDSASVRSTIRSENPPLPRTSKVLKASGRYSSMLIVDPAAVTCDNPTGMIETQGLALASVNWDRMKSTMPAGTVLTTDPITVALVMRGGDPVSCSYLRITEYVNKQINESNQYDTDKGTQSRPTSGRHRGPHCSKPNLIKIDVSENNGIITDLGIKSVPTFLMFHGARLVYGGPIGGRKVKLDTTQKPQVLLVESNFRDQVPAEKTLRRMGCDSFLCLNVSEAIMRIQQMCKNTQDANGKFRNPVLFDVVLISEEVPTDSMNVLQKELAEYIKSKRTVVSMLVSVLGEHGKRNLEAVRWDHACTDDVSAFNRTAFTSLCSQVIQKPIKPMAIEKLLTQRTVPHNDANFGLTPDTLMSKISSVQNEVLNCQAKEISRVGIRMSTHDTRLRGGVSLASST